MGLGWADWIRFVLTPLVLGSIAAIVATRNAKKTPHERLKNLVDIHDKMPEDLDSRKVVEAAIARELIDFDRRVAADQRGFWAGARERFAQFSGISWTIPVGFVLAGSAAAIVVSAITHEPLNQSWALIPGIIVSLLAAVIGALIAYRASRTERQTLNLDRAAAYITATFARVVIQDLASRDVFSPEEVQGVIGDAATRLEAMGVFESDGRSGLRVTPFGKKAIELSLREVDRQHIAHWANVAAEMNARDDGSGREAPGQ